MELTQITRTIGEQSQHRCPYYSNIYQKTNGIGLTVIDDAAKLDFPEFNSEAFKNVLNSIINDCSNLDEVSSSTIMSKKIPGVGTSISRIDYV